MGVFAYYNADTDGIVYHVVPSPESEYAPSTLYSETDSTPSRSTIRSDDLPGYFVLHNGRQQPASENIAKWFPYDSTRRCILRYFVPKSIFGSDYSGPVKDMLSPQEERTRQVLEVGTKTGTWIQAMAAEFPHVQFRTLDVAPMIAHAPCRNVIFEVYDFTQGFLLEDESQDIVFLNFVLEVRDYRALLREVYRVLRPGGLIHVIDVNVGLWEPEDLTALAGRAGSHTRRLNCLVRQGLLGAGINPDTGDKLAQWLAPDSDLWTEGQHGFVDIRSYTRSWPFFPHDGHSCMDTINPSIAPYMKHLSSAILRDLVTYGVDYGLAHQEAEKLAEGTLEEAKQAENCCAIKSYHIHATKA